jgi:hypothetical protein
MQKHTLGYSLTVLVAMCMGLFMAPACQKPVPVDDSDLARAQLWAVYDAEVKYRDQLPNHRYSKDLQSLQTAGFLPELPSVPDGSYTFSYSPAVNPDGSVWSFVVMASPTRSGLPYIMVNAEGDVASSMTKPED